MWYCRVPLMTTFFLTFFWTTNSTPPSLGCVHATRKKLTRYAHLVSIPLSLITRYPVMNASLGGRFFPINKGMNSSGHHMMHLVWMTSLLAASSFTDGTNSYVGLFVKMFLEIPFGGSFWHYHFSSTVFCSHFSIPFSVSNRLSHF